MRDQVIKLSNNAAERIKEILLKSNDSPIGVRVGVKSGGCAGMSYIMEYAKEVKPNEEIIEDKGVKVLIDPKCYNLSLLGTEMDYKEENFRLNLCLKILMKLKDVVVVNLLKFNRYNTFQILLDEEYVQNYIFPEILNLYKHRFDHL